MYYVNRNGQQYGPYSEETISRYLAEGSLLASDSARSEGAQSWQPLGQILQYTPLSARPPAVPPPASRPAAGTQIVPPDLHWAIVLLLSCTLIFPIIWAFVQANWARKIDPASKATILYAFWAVGEVILLILDAAIFVAIANNDLQSVQSMSVAIWLVGLPTWVLFLLAVFSIRKSMVNYYKTVEPIQLRLSGVMTFFFSILYLQYHMSRIAKWKQTGVLSA